MMQFGSAFELDRQRFVCAVPVENFPAPQSGGHYNRRGKT
jgi:hypothetical protein